MSSAKVFWFTGLSGAGKTTVAALTKTLLEAKGYRVIILDGDEIRAKYGVPVGFSKEDIQKNNQFVASHCVSIKSEWDIILVPIISPYRDSRQRARDLLSPNFYEIYINASLEAVAKRDTKGLYQKAKSGQLNNLIGYSESSPYEVPLNADLVLATEKETPEISANKLALFIQDKMNARLS